MRNKHTVVFALLLLLVGVGVLLYPVISSSINKMHGSYAIQEFRDQIGQTNESMLARERQRAEKYNQALLSAESPEEYDSILNFANGMMGYIQIPRINVSLPIYHGVEEEILSRGVGHMPESAFPIGGEGNHAVLTGHTGLPAAKLFTDLTDLELEDMFYINILEETLAYRVDQIRVVLPSDGQELAPQPGKDYCTLVTCTPYGVNSHRLLVRGQRVEIPKEEAQQQIVREMTWRIPWGWILSAAVLAMFAVFVFRRLKKLFL